MLSSSQCWFCSDLITAEFCTGPEKKRGPRLGSGAPEGAFQLLASFSRQRVGSSILASLSEAGGYGPQKVTSKPLPPRLSLFASRHLKRAHGSRQCKISANSRPADNSIKCFIMWELLLACCRRETPKLHS